MNTSTSRALAGDHCRCPSCHLYFNSTTAFDRHRTGKIGTPARRCLTETEMLAKGMTTNAGGWWITAPRPAGICA